MEDNGHEVESRVVGIGASSSTPGASSRPSLTSTNISNSNSNSNLNGGSGNSNNNNNIVISNTRRTSLMLSSNAESKSNLIAMVHQKWRKMWRRDSAIITKDDPSYKVVYLGNVVTTWAKGEGCLERPASALWRNHTQGRGSIKMCVTVTASGLKAQTREHGLTEYWANRLTWCGVPPDYPKLFCWIYRHEGRKLKQELRCHAVLCSKEERAKCLATTLRNRLAEALFDFRKEKLLRQNARLSIVQSLYNNSSTKRRLVVLNTNCTNYKPPLERSKSAPKLSCIEEYEEDENEENEEDILCNNLPVLPEQISGAEIPEEEDQVILDNPSTPLGDYEEGEEKIRGIVQEECFEEESIVVSRRPGTPPLNGKSDSRLNMARRPNSVPMDAKLNLPYLTGYDKVMHMLDIPTRESRDALLLLEDDLEGDLLQADFPTYPFVATNSDPVASSPTSDAESVVDSSDDDEFGKSREEDENEINDNVSDESGYSEEAQHMEKSIDLAIRCKSTKSASTRQQGILNSNKNKNSINQKMSSTTVNPAPTPTSATNITSPCLVLYDNLCFEI